MSRPPTRVLVLGIDAANPTLLREWAAEGFLPTLQSLFARGVSGPTRSIDGFFVGSTWPSFSTGMTPAKHGFHYAVQLRPGSYDFHWPADHGITRRDPFWSYLSRAGRRVAILDVPLTRIDPSLNGVQVVEWGSHDAVYGFHASPSDLEETIRSRFGDHPLGRSCDGVRTSVAEYEALLGALLRGVYGKTQLTKELLHRERWDFFMQVFTESHCVGHQCWHLRDESHPAHDRAVARAIGDPLRRVYTAIDTAIGEVVAEAGDTLVIVLAAHGMSHWYGAQFLLRDILTRLGVADPIARGKMRSAATTSARWAWHRIPTRARRRLIPLLDRLQGHADRARTPPTWGVRPQASRCFPVANGLAVGGIRLNVIGREPHGVLRAGAAADDFCDTLTADLLDVVDERTGGPLIRRVIRTAHHFAGEHLDDLPDLLVEWNDATPTGSTVVAAGADATVRARSPKIGVVEGANEYSRTGEHRIEGMFVATGPGIRPARLECTVSILDFAPTIAAVLDVDVPECDGRPIPEIVRDSLRMD